MTNVELKQRFEERGFYARDFIRWAETKGVKVHDATVSRHLSGAQSITQPWVLAYLYFFEEQESFYRAINDVMIDITAAREKILVGLVEKVEGRPAEISDAQNLTLIYDPSTTHTIVEYKDVRLGYIKVDSIKNAVIFVPI